MKMIKNTEKLIKYLRKNMTTGCSGYEHTNKFLKKNLSVDSKKLIRFLQSHDGYCDCEVLMNVIPSLEVRR